MDYGIGIQRYTLMMIWCLLLDLVTIKQIGSLLISIDIFTSMFTTPLHPLISIFLYNVVMLFGLSKNVVAPVY